MKRSRPDPLLLFLLASMGAPVACGGSSSSERASDPLEGGAASGGTAGTGNAGTAGGGTGGAGGTGGTAGAAAGAGGTGPSTCEQPAPFMGATTGFVRCGNGLLHHASVGACALHPPTTEVRHPGSTLCQTDADCASTAHGLCASLADMTGVQCRSECVADTDCLAGEACLCGDEINHCVAAACATDGDCAAGMLCASYSSVCGAGPIGGFACQAPADQCTTDGDCSDAGISVCMPQEAVRMCVGAGGCGRPFLVEGEPRLAPVVERDDYCAPLPRLGLDALDPLERAALAAHFTRMASMEHASIAAFARFALELVAVGAPSDLLAASVRALDDEQRHTRLCFALASDLAGRRLGPGALDPGDVGTAGDLAAIVATTLLEGCVGETLAAMEARELARDAESSVLRDVLDEIARDESRHAALAFRFLHWALARDPSLRAVIAHVTAQVRAANTAAKAEPAPPTIESPRLARWGLPTFAQRRELRARAIEGVVLPCLDVLLRGGADAGSLRPPLDRYTDQRTIGV